MVRRLTAQKVEWLSSFERSMQTLLFRVVVGTYQHPVVTVLLEHEPAEDSMASLVRRSVRHLVIKECWLIDATFRLQELAHCPNLITFRAQGTWKEYPISFLDAWGALSAPGTMFQPRRLALDVDIDLFFRIPGLDELGRNMTHLELCHSSTDNAEDWPMRLFPQLTHLALFTEASVGDVEDYIQALMTRFSDTFSGRDHCLQRLLLIFDHESGTDWPSEITSDLQSRIDRATAPEVVIGSFREVEEEFLGEPWFIFDDALTNYLEEVKDLYISTGPDLWERGEEMLKFRKAVCFFFCSWQPC